VAKSAVSLVRFTATHQIRTPRPRGRKKLQNSNARQNAERRLGRQLSWLALLRTRFCTGLTQWACIVLVSTATHLTYSHWEHMKV
jgi:hypothetical protein